MNGYAVTIIELARLKPTEEVEAARVEQLVRELTDERTQRLPILVERDSLAILDGHHRYRAAEALGLARIAAIAIAYDDPRLTLSSWCDRAFTPRDVIDAAQSGRLFPKKSTRHILSPPIAEAPVPLDALLA